MGALTVPHAQLRNFLAQRDLDALLTHVLAARQTFKPATVRKGGESIVKDAARVALTSGDFGDLKPMVRQRFLDALPEVRRLLGAAGPPPERVELELAAHGNGAFYQPHTDMPIGETRQRRPAEADRLLSAVFYFYAEPKGFTGGELRLFKLGAPDEFTDIEPLNNSLVVFHSWMLHEVRPVQVPSGDFQDYRFAINCWYRRTLNAAPTAPGTDSTQSHVR